MAASYTGKYVLGGTLAYLWSKIDSLFVRKTAVDDGAQVNVIETIKVNGQAQTVTSKAVDITVPTDNASLANGAGYQTSSQVNSAIADAVDTLKGNHFIVVTQLPAVASAQKGAIYLVAHSHEDSNDNFDEYIVINNEWELLGNTDIDLSGYVKSSEIVPITNAEIDTICT